MSLAINKLHLAGQSLILVKRKGRIGGILEKYISTCEHEVKISQTMLVRELFLLNERTPL